MGKGRALAVLDHLDEWWFGGNKRVTYFHRGIFRNGGFHIRTRRRRGGLVLAGGMVSR